MSSITKFRPDLLGVVLGLSVAACSGGGNGGTANNGDGDGDAGPVGDGDQMPGDGDGDGDGMPTGPLCGTITCGVGQRCMDGTPPVCVDNACGDLNCGETAACVPAPGGGNMCKSIACSTDAQCVAAQHCDGTKCVDDVCEPDVQACDGNTVVQCSSNGGGETPRFTCLTGGYVESSCMEAASGAFGCSCTDDWDCPSFTDCNAGTCEGTGVEPTCKVSVADFKDVLPKVEPDGFWGGLGQKGPATGRPFPDHAQVAATPMVANLDDDNGDGFINEFDFPEIIFITYPNKDSVEQNGIVRAIHGGGPNRGKDYFAACKAMPWKEGDAITTDACADADASVRPGSGLAVGDADGDGIPEIFVAAEGGKLQILDNHGVRMSQTDAFYPSSSGKWKYPQIALANLDNRGYAEVIIGPRVATLQKDDQGIISVLDIFVGDDTKANGAPDDGSKEFGPSVCPANLLDTDPNDDDVTQEIVMGTTLYAFPTNPDPANIKKVADCPGSDTSDFCKKKLTFIWDAKAVNSAANINQEGLCAVADVWGSNKDKAPGPGVDPNMLEDTELDRVPEVILVSNGHIRVFRSVDGVLIKDVSVEDGQRGGAPNIDDFDADGFPEVAMASSGFYTVVDLQTPDAAHCPAWPDAMGSAQSAASPGTNTARTPGGACTSDSDCNSGSICSPSLKSCVCLHNGWKRTTDDNSSKVTSSSVFDFNGDGAAEVVYGDECYFRIYDGKNGDIHLAMPSMSRTIMENPVVADVDNDGNAEIVVVMNNEQALSRCSETDLPLPPVPGQPTQTVTRDSLPNGINVYGDLSDSWVSARRIWNEHSYHVTNVTEGGQIPLREPESWLPYGNRFYNTYRSQPRSSGVAPDLVLVDLQISSPDVTCGQLSDQLNLTVLVKNQGDLRVGPGVPLKFYGKFGGDFEALLLPANGNDPRAALTYTLTNSLEPGASVLISVPFAAADSLTAALPSDIAVTIDEAVPGVSPNGTERECHEDNNRIEKPVTNGGSQADLRLEVGATGGDCGSANVAVTVFNDGSVAAKDVLVRIYAGDPSAGGLSIGEVMVAGPIDPGAQMGATVQLGSQDRDIKLFGVADPLDAIPECNNANNVAQGPDLMCASIILL
ncbi:MAG: VCBS repeat-containing protein [Myxococcales bacterium]